MRYKLSPACKLHRTDVVFTTQFCMVVIQRCDNMDFAPTVEMDRREILTHSESGLGEFELTVEMDRRRGAHELYEPSNT